MSRIRFERWLATLFSLALAVGCGGDSSGPKDIDQGSVTDPDAGVVDAEAPECTSASDCESGVCDASGLCQVASCSDGVLNGDESAVDCGGSCDRCEIGSACMASEDCGENAFCDDAAQICACEDGFEAGEDGACIDVDECANQTDSCDENATCTNTPGGYSCACDGPDFVGDGETCFPSIDCVDGDAVCDANATCEDQGEGVSICECAEGYLGNGETCADVDECLAETDNCDALAGCTNTDGGFTCGSCPDGYDDVNGDGTSCVDIDECDLETDNCDVLTTCNNTDGGFTCSGCPNGYDDVNGDGTSCVDIDECDLGIDACSDLTECHNTQGGYTCGSCSPGFDDVNGDGTSCVDIDECDLGVDNCDSLTTCSNTDGSFTCSACPAGYDDVNGDGTSCVDIDECDLGTDNCDSLAGCSNTAGGFTCGSCPAGYDDVNSDGTSCVDINECDLGTDNCDSLAGCSNTTGGFTCGSCPAGYDDVNSDGTSCVDINECDLGTDNCDSLAGCSNMAGGFTCGSCPAGYDDVNADGTSCMDINECALGTDNCDTLTTCSNTDGSFTCSACPAGYIDVNSDGTECTRFGSCAEIAQSDPSATTGTYTIDTGTGGPIDVHCDMDSDGGIGHTMVRIDDSSLGGGQDAYRAQCASIGMELIVPRTRAHANAIKTWNGGQYPGIVGVYPKYNGASGLENWEGECNGVRGCRFWLSNTRNVNCAGFEPNGDNNTSDALLLVGNSCDWGQWNDANDSMGLNRGSVICSTNDAQLEAATSCLAALNSDSVYNTDETGGINGAYDIDPEQDDIAMSLTCDMTGGGWTEISREDFESGTAAGWSPSTTSSACYGTTMLGGYNVFGSGVVATKTFDLLNVPHTEVDASLRFFIIDSWDSEYATVILGGTTIYDELFSGAFAATNTCGRSEYRDHGPQDVSGTIPHTTNSVSLTATTDLDSAAHDESWGIDDVVIRVR